MAIDWEARDKRITAGQIKGNIVTNAVHLYSNTDKYENLKDAAMHILDLHKYVESLDVLTYLEPKKVSKNKHIEAFNACNSEEELLNYRNKHKKQLSNLKGEDRDLLLEAYNKRLKEI